MNNLADQTVARGTSQVNFEMDSDNKSTTGSSLRRVLRLIVATLLVIVVLELLFYLLILPKLHLTKVLVTADFPIADSDVLGMAGLVGNEPFFSLDAAVVSNQIQNDLIVAEAAVTLHFPDTIRFELVSRKPAAMVLLERNDKTLEIALVDKTGLVFLLGGKAWDYVEQEKVPVISGLSPDVIQLGSQLPPRIEKLLSDLYQIQESDQILIDLISEVRLVPIGSSAENILSDINHSFDLLIYPVGFKIPLRFRENVSSKQLSKAFFLLDAITSDHQKKGLPKIFEIDFRSSPPVALFQRGIPSGE